MMRFRSYSVVACAVMAGSGCRGASVVADQHALGSAGDLSVWNAYAPEPVTGDVGAVYFSVRNDGESADQLVTVSADVAGEATFHLQVDEGGMQVMTEVPDVAVPAGGVTVFEPGGLHVMLTDLQRPYRQGDSIRLSIRFARTGTIEFVTPVVSYQDVARRADAAHRAHRP